MARRPGNGRKDQNIEYAECHRLIYGEGIVSARNMGQDPFVWFNDAITSHVYRCELIQAQERYQADMQAFTKGERSVSPQQWEPQYQVTREKPTITRTGPGQGSGSNSRSYRP